MTPQGSAEIGESIGVLVSWLTHGGSSAIASPALRVSGSVNDRCGYCRALRRRSGNQYLRVFSKYILSI